MGVSSFDIPSLKVLPLTVTDSTPSGKFSFTILAFLSMISFRLLYSCILSLELDIEPRMEDLLLRSLLLEFCNFFNLFCATNSSWAVLSPDNVAAISLNVIPDGSLSSCSSITRDDISPFIIWLMKFCFIRSLS